MDLYPLYNSLRIALISSVLVFFAGIVSSYYVSKARPLTKGLLDVIFTIPLVLPPTVIGYMLLLLLGPARPVGKFFIDHFQLRLTMRWYSAVFAVTVVSFPLMYRTARGAFESFDETYAEAGRTLGLSGSYIFWKIRFPYCRKGIAAGAVLAFARALGEYGATSMIAGYTPGRTSTVSTEVYSLWTAGEDALALRWIMINIAISCAVLLTVNLLEKKELK